jgi:hypothetical protein
MSMSLDDLTNTRSFTTGGKSQTGRATFLPEPSRQTRYYTVISADDHVVEPPDIFKGRIPKGLVADAPRVVEKDGAHVWLYDKVEIPNIGFNAVVGRPFSEYSFEPSRFEEMRRGAWDIDARIADIIACQIPWLLDPELAGREIERNAPRGFKAVSSDEGRSL